MMFKKVALAVTVASVLAFSSLVTTSTAEAGCPYGGGYGASYSSGYGGGFGGYSYAPRRTSFYGGYGGGYSPACTAPRRHRGLRFSIGF